MDCSKFHGALVQLICPFAILLRIEASTRVEDDSELKFNNTVPDLLRGNFIVPDVIPVAPKEAIEVWYGHTPVNFGTIFPLSKVQNKPTNITWPALKNALYTLLLFGPDLGAMDLLTRGWNHWLVVNIPENRVNDGDVHTEYNSIDEDLYRLEGLYRLLFLVYKQPNNESIPVPNANIKTRMPLPNLPTLFCIGEFAKTHNFGPPTAANFFHVEGTDKIFED
ncbi:protein D3-like [Bemisia tabaci]|uniref:protein D3-like n=1 Tax=Bemisia tabaci TaxID=7038 RepID=UPI003B28CC86